MININDFNRLYSVGINNLFIIIKIKTQLRSNRFDRLNRSNFVFVTKQWEFMIKTD